MRNLQWATALCTCSILFSSSAAALQACGDEYAMSVFDISSGSLDINIDAPGLGQYDIQLNLDAESDETAFIISQAEPLTTTGNEIHGYLSGATLTVPCLYGEGLGVFSVDLLIKEDPELRLVLAGTGAVQGAVASAGSSVDSVEVHIANPLVKAGDSAVAYAIAKTSDDRVVLGKTPQWSVSAPGKAMVGADGTLTGIEHGKTNLIATVDNVAGDTQLSIYEDGFVTNVGPQFMLDGEPFYLAGANGQQHLAAYSHYGLEYAIENAEYFGVNAVRIWGSSNAGSVRDDSVETLGVEIDIDDEDITGEYPYHRPIYQYWDTDTQQIVYNEQDNGLPFLDRYIYLAKQAGIKVVFNLEDNWEWYWGGINQYVIWFGGNRHEDFYVNEDMKQAYKNWVSYLLNRVNTYTGVAYKDEPTIMSWDILNEAGCFHDTASEGVLSWDEDTEPYCNNEIIEAWITEMAAYVKSIDSKHLLAVGGQGHFTNTLADTYDPQMGHVYYTTNEPGMRYILSDPNIDLATYHMYPYESPPGDGSLTPLEWGSRYIQDRLALSDEYNKPVVLEEFGATEAEDLLELIDPWLTLLYEHNRAGFMFYDLGSYIAPDEPSYGPTAPGITWNIYPETPGADLLKAWVEKYQE
jgi:mannan endo-1,4-beta-mannosidase